MASEASGGASGNAAVAPAAPRDLAVVLPTRDRGDSLLRPLRALLSRRDLSLEIVVVDQSADDRTRDGLAALAGDARLLHRRSERRGLSHALNEGVESCAAEIVAFTGDDCEIAADWPGAILAAFAADARVGVVFGEVEAAAHDPQAGFVPGFVCRARTTARRVRDKSAVGGTSACMAVRREVFQRLHGFDTSLGLGAPLRAAEETDFAIRALQAGFWIVEEPRARVVHHGFVAWDGLPGLIERNWFGTGAAVAKLVRRDPGAATVVLAGLARLWLAPASSGVGATLGAGSHRPARLRAFAAGMATGLRWPIDARTGHFAPRG